MCWCYIISLLTCFKCSVRKCFGDQMLSYLIIPPEKRGICWKIGHIIISFPQLIYTQISAAKSSIYQDSKNYYELYKKSDNECIAYPWNQSVIVCDKETIIRDVPRLHQIRDGAMISYEGDGHYSDISTYNHVHCLSSDDKRHHIMRAIHTLCYKVDLDLKKPINEWLLPSDGYLNKYFTSMNEVKKSLFGSYV